MLKGAAETSEFLGKRAAAAAREWEGRRYNRSENDEKKKAEKQPPQYKGQRGGRACRREQWDGELAGRRADVSR